MLLFTSSTISLRIASQSLFTNDGSEYEYTAMQPLGLSTRSASS